MSDTPITDEEFAYEVEVINSPVAKIIEELERQLAETRRERDELLAALEYIGRDMDYVSIWRLQYVAREAIAKVKGGQQ